MPTQPPDRPGSPVNDPSADPSPSAYPDGVPGDVLVERLRGKSELSSEEMDELMAATRRIREASRPAPHGSPMALVPESGSVPDLAEP